LECALDHSSVSSDTLLLRTIGERLVDARIAIVSHVNNPLKLYSIITY
jgi:hypothetical protein